MQKKLNFVIFHKTLILFFGLIMLFLLLIWTKQEKIAAYTPVSEPFKAQSTMYKQLEPSPGSESAVLQDADEMNNLFSENSNIFLTESELSSLNTVRLLDANTQTVREVPLEYYTLCVLIAEMPQSFAPQALMAQAVACRTFAVRGALAGSKHPNADVCTDYRCCQSFCEADTAGFDISAAREAVRATEGIVAVYNGEPILAAYHASSVGFTRSSAEVWGGALDYLVPVAAAEDKEAAACTVVYEEKKVKSAFAKYGLDGEPVFTYDSEGICTGVSAGNAYLSPQQVQNALGLRSDTFAASRGDGRYAFTCYGYGHGVGLSQYGADALAHAGYDFYEILQYYYTGITFAFAGLDSKT
ncbi:MAG: SpoIID/LytB domain-containing protein [Eubacteriales bacterium]